MKNYAFDKKLVFLILGAIIGWSIIGFLTYRLLILDIRKLSQNISSQEVNLAQLNYNGQHYSIFKEDYEKVVPDLSGIEKIVLSEPEFILFVQSLEKIARDNSLIQKINLEQANASREAVNLTDNEYLQNKKKADKKPPQPFSPLAFNIELEGNFASLVKYIVSLENLVSFPNLKYLTVNLRGPEKEGDQSDKVQALLQVEVYLEKTGAK